MSSAPIDLIAGPAGELDSGHPAELLRHSRAENDAVPDDVTDPASAGHLAANWTMDARLVHQ